jgi:molybdopterin-guanine dinucleotide biosynthesis protein A
MSFSRPDMVRRVVAEYHTLPLLRKMVGEVIVWNANPGLDEMLDLVEAHKGVVRVVAARPDLGLHSRFTAALLAAAPTVLVVDEDMPVDEAGIVELLRRQAREPEVLHGPHCRYPTRFHPYPVFTPRRQHAPIVLTKVLAGRRELFAQFFVYAPFLDPVARLAQPPWNGEDVLLSLAVVRRNGGRLNRCHPDLEPLMADRVVNLTGVDTISGLPQHYSYRWRFTAEVMRVLGLYANNRFFEDFPFSVVSDVPFLAPTPLDTNYLLRFPDDALKQLKDHAREIDALAASVGIETAPFVQKPS